MDMKKYLKKLLRENLLSERLTDVDIDVDMLYNKYFKHDVEELEGSGMYTNKIFNYYETNTSILQSEEAKQAHILNPCKIIINDGKNFYNPNEKTIGIGINDNASNYIFNNHGGDFKKAIESLNPSQQSSLSKEFKEEKIKGSIHHELAHWIDDTMNKQHISKRIGKQIKLGRSDLGGISVNASKMEIQGQIHNVKQLYNKYKDTWDEMPFQKLLSLSIPLGTIYKELSGDIRKQWIRDLKTRMNREIMDYDIVNTDKLSHDEKIILDMIINKKPYDFIADKLKKSKSESMKDIKNVFNKSIVVKDTLLGKKMYY